VITFEAAAVVVVVVGGAGVDEVAGGSEVAPPVTGTDDEPERVDPDVVIADGVVADVVVDVVAGRATGRGSRLLEHPTTSTVKAAPATTHRPLVT
jgi:hypothetical protein